MDYSQQQTDIMLALYPDKVISSAELEHRFNVSDSMTIHDMVKAKLLHYTNDYHSDEVYLTQKGRAYIDDTAKDDTRYITSLKLSISAIGISIGALIVAIIDLIK